MSSARVFEKRTFGDLLADIQGKSERTKQRSAGGL